MYFSPMDCLDLTECGYLAVFPPVLPLQLCSAGLKLGCASLQRVCTVIQLRQLLVALQHFVHVDAHDIYHLHANVSFVVIMTHHYFILSSSLKKKKSI